MDCAYCGHRIPPGVMDCPRCGGPAVSSGPPAPGRGPARSGAPATGQIYTSAPTGADLEAAASRPVPPRAPGDPEAELRTQLVSGDRQEALETRIVEIPPAAKPGAAAVAAQGPAGLPDSKVARGVEDTFIGVKRVLYRLGRIGRLSFYAHCAVIVGAVSPWFYVAHQGYTPGIEQMGWLPLALSAAAIGTLLWRFRPTPRQRVLPVLLHLALTAGLVLSILWVLRTTLDMPDHLRPAFAPGYYISGAGAAVAALSSLIGLKDVR